LIKNKFLEKLLIEKGENKEEVWQSIITNDGSVQHLDFLNDWEKDVFKTAIEIDQHWIIQHAADRQKYICQGQSVNLFFLPTVNIKYLHDVHWAAWEKGLKGLYYLRSQGVKNSENISKKIERIIRQEEPVCLGCEG
jgi:ribonucleoside-diphosphate reductase alpha chain